MDRSDSRNDSSSDESILDDVDNDPDFVLSNASSLSDTRYDDDLTNAQQANAGAGEQVVIDFIDFTEWHDVSLDPLPKHKTNSEVWNYFGILKKGDKIFEPMSKRRFCWPCFDAHKFKR